MTSATTERPRTGRERFVPFSEDLGIRVETADAGEATVSLTLQPRLLNNHGIGHGGVLMTLLDVAMAHAALSRVDYRRELVTVDMHTGFLAGAKGNLLATGRATGGGKSICFCEAWVEDETGTIAARAMGTFRYRDA